jgi:oligosaccharide repeat unit polymerase
VQSCKFKQGINLDPSKLIRDIYLLLSILSYPSFLIWVYSAITSNVTDNWALNLRIAALGQLPGVSTEVYGGVHILLWQVSFLLELVYFNKKKWYRVILPGLFYLSFGIFTMSKAVLLNLFMITIIILYVKKIVRLKHLLIGLCVLFFVFFSLQTIRHGNNASTNSKDSFMVLYLLSSMSAFDTVEPMSSTHFGENVFRLFYAAFHSFGLTSIEPINPILDFIKKPIETNTYTGMYPFFKDFGYWGVGVFALLYGLFYGWLFKKLQYGSSFYIILFSYFSALLVMQYVAEMIFTNLAGHIKFFIILYIPFLFSKVRIVVKH